MNIYTSWNPTAPAPNPGGYTNWNPTAPAPNPGGYTNWNPTAPAPNPSYVGGGNDLMMNAFANLMKNAIGSIFAMGQGQNLGGTPELSGLPYEPAPIEWSGLPYDPGPPELSGLPYEPGPPELSGLPFEPGPEISTPEEPAPKKKTNATVVNAGFSKAKAPDNQAETANVITNPTPLGFSGDNGGQVDGGQSTIGVKAALGLFDGDKDNGEHE